MGFEHLRQEIGPRRRGHPAEEPPRAVQPRVERRLLALGGQRGRVGERHREKAHDVRGGVGGLAEQRHDLFEIDEPPLRACREGDEELEDIDEEGFDEDDLDEDDDLSEDRDDDEEEESEDDVRALHFADKLVWSRSANLFRSGRPCEAEAGCC